MFQNESGKVIMKKDLVLKTQDVHQTEFVSPQQTILSVDDTNLLTLIASKPYSLIHARIFISLFIL